MGSPEKVSPMTAYYLRKLILSNKYHLDASVGTLEMSPSFEDSVRSRIRTIPFPNVLEKLVTLHQSLHLSAATNSEQIQGIELQIYEMLGLTKKERSPINQEDTQRPVNYCPKKYRDVLKRLYSMIQKVDSLISPRITVNYLQKTQPDLQKLADEHHGHLQPAQSENNDLALYEQWTHSFCDQWESIIPKKVNEGVLRNPDSKLDSRTSQLQEATWADLHQTISLASFFSNTSAPRRSRDLVKLLNALSLQSAQLIGPMQTRYYLLESRPENEWCHMFMISEMGAITYCGNIREIITSSRLHVFKSWMKRFWQMCETKRH